MLRTNLVFVFNKKWEILLNMKKRGFWVGKWNGAGGKVKSEESVKAAARRELEEETWICVKESDLMYRGILHFAFDGKSDWDQDCDIFTIKDYDGPEPIETEEMRPKWYSIENIPFKSMWPDDPYWLPDILEGKMIEWSFLFNTEGKILKMKNLISAQ